MPLASIRPTARPLRLVLLGAAPDTGNLGVTALGRAVLRGIVRHVPGADVTVFDHGRGLRPERVELSGDQAIDVVRCGAVDTRKPWRVESYDRARLCRRAGRAHPILESLRGADVVLDASGGDSFSDLYGPRRFRAVTTPKLLALDLGRPLVLLPQTLGPFDDERHLDVARRIVRGAAMVWTRDLASFGRARRWLGAHLDPTRHRAGIDLAFSLLPSPAPLDAALRPWAGAPLRAAVNVSGLLDDGHGRARRRFGLAVDPHAFARALVGRLLADPRVAVLLVAHVVPKSGHESDHDACTALAGDLEAAAGGRLYVAPPPAAPEVAKAILGRAHWFCAGRMHAAIAALSSGVPGAVLAYSDKARDVLEPCGAAAHIVDARHGDTDSALAEAWRSWSARDLTRSDLGLLCRPLAGQADRELEEILDGCAALAAGARSRRAA